MDKNTLISSFGKWVAPINFSHFEKQVAATNQDKYTKKLTTMAYLKLFLYAHLHEVESLRALSDAVLDEDFGQALGLDEISAAHMDKETVYPEKAIITPANVHDHTQLEVLVDEKEAMYVFDRGDSTAMVMKAFSSLRV